MLVFFKKINSLIEGMHIRDKKYVKVLSVFVMVVHCLTNKSIGVREKVLIINSLSLHNMWSGNIFMLIIFSAMRYSNPIGTVSHFLFIQEQ